MGPRLGYPYFRLKAKQGLNEEVSGVIREGLITLNGMKTWRIMTNEPVEAELLSSVLQNSTGPESVSLEQRTETGIWEWTFTSSGENENEAQEHQDIVRYNKGNKMFWFDGGGNAKLRSRVFVGYGNGSQTQFILPYRWIYESSLVVSVNNVVVTAWTLTGKAITFTSAPAANALIHIEHAVMRFKCYCVADNESMYKQTDSFKSFSSKDIKFREFSH